MDAFKNLFSNEHGFVMFLLIIGATVLTAVGKMTVDQWTTYSQWIFGIFMGGHAVMSAADSIGNARSNAAPPAPTAAAVVMVPDATK
jgi:Ni,Fe-hydrogenase I cytochrome b subunit